MCVTSTAKRRRRQAKNQNRHLARIGRRIYKPHSAGYYRKQLMRRLRKEKTIAENKAKSKSRG